MVYEAVQALMQIAALTLLFVYTFHIMPGLHISTT